MDCTVCMCVCVYTNGGADPTRAPAVSKRGVVCRDCIAAVRCRWKRECVWGGAKNGWKCPQLVSWTTINAIKNENDIYIVVSNRPSISSVTIIPVTGRCGSSSFQGRDWWGGEGNNFTSCKREHCFVTPATTEGMKAGRRRNIYVNSL